MSTSSTKTLNAFLVFTPRRLPARRRDHGSTRGLTTLAWWPGAPLQKEEDAAVRQVAGSIHANVFLAAGIDCPSRLVLDAGLLRLNGLEQQLRERDAPPTRREPT
jgi:hypothetical protein